MREIWLYTLFVIFVGFISCEQNADPIDFVPEEVINNAIGGGSEVPDILPDIDNPILVANVNGTPFFAVDFDVTLSEIGGGEEVLEIFFIDENGSEIIIDVTNPETQLYEINSSGAPSFTGAFFDIDEDENFSTLTSSSSSGQLFLTFEVVGGLPTVSARFDFTAFLESSTGVPSRFVEITSGSFDNIPVTIL